MVEQKHVLDTLVTLLKTDKPARLASSKGGWEGWLQCELWHALEAKGIPVEREVRYPGSSSWCDLVVGNGQPRIWVELKAFGGYSPIAEDQADLRIKKDLNKLQYAPRQDRKLLLFILPTGTKHQRIRHFVSQTHQLHWRLGNGVDILYQWW